MKQIFVVGDSISIHYDPYLKKMLVGKLGYDRKGGTQEALMDLDRAVGANGGDSRLVLKYLTAELPKIRNQAEILMVNCGLHDIRTDQVTGAKQVGAAEYRDNLKKIIDLAQPAGLQLIWVRTTPVDTKQHNSHSSEFFRFAEDVIAYNQIADRIMLEHQVPLIDLYTFTRNLGMDLYCDHVHFREEIRMLQAAFIVGNLWGIIGEQ